MRMMTPRSPDFLCLFVSILDGVIGIDDNGRAEDMLRLGSNKGVD